MLVWHFHVGSRSCPFCFMSPFVWLFPAVRFQGTELSPHGHFGGKCRHSAFPDWRQCERQLQDPGLHSQDAAAFGRRNWIRDYRPALGKVPCVLRDRRNPDPPLFWWLRILEHLLWRHQKKHRMQAKAVSFGSHCSSWEKQLQNSPKKKKIVVINISILHGFSPPADFIPTLDFIITAEFFRRI